MDLGMESETVEFKRSTSEMREVMESVAAIQVDIFWDVVDIYNPGSFPAGYAPEDYLTGAETASKPRNPLIASTLYRSGDIGTYGTGLWRIQNVCDAQGVPVEVFQWGNSVHVRFTRAEAVTAADSPVTRRQVTVPPVNHHRQKLRTVESSSRGTS